MNNYWSLIIWVAVVGGIFAFMWHKGYLIRMRDYIGETQQELKKCTWPTVEELKGSVVVVVVTIALLGVFTVGVDWILSKVIGLMLA